MLFVDITDIIENHIKYKKEHHAGKTAVVHIATTSRS
jgi:hypothetical protein